jgi:hypothetical protein
MFFVFDDRDEADLRLPWPNNAHYAALRQSLNLCYGLLASPRKLL